MKKLFIKIILFFTAVIFSLPLFSCGNTEDFSKKPAAGTESEADGLPPASGGDSSSAGKDDGSGGLSPDGGEGGENAGGAENQPPVFGFSDNGEGYTLVSVTGGTDSVRIPAEQGGKPVTSIAVSAFSRNKEVKEIFIPESVEKIEAYAFDGCAALVAVNFSDASGWSADEKGFSAEILSNPSYAAIYLKQSFGKYEWLKTPAE